MMLGYSHMITAVMLPSRQGGDILLGMRALICAWGRDKLPVLLSWFESRGRTQNSRDWVARIATMLPY